MNIGALTHKELALLTVCLTLAGVSEAEGVNVDELSERLYEMLGERFSSVVLSVEV